jgi:hypothetical protein
MNQNQKNKLEELELKQRELADEIRRLREEPTNPEPEAGQVWSFSKEEGPTCSLVLLTSNGGNVMLRRSGREDYSASCGRYTHRGVSKAGTYLGTFTEWLQRQKDEAVQAYADQVKAALSFTDSWKDSVLEGTGGVDAEAIYETRKALASLNPPIKADK